MRALVIVAVLSSTAYAQQVAGDADPAAAVYLGSSKTPTVATEPTGTNRVIARGAAVATAEPIRDQVVVRRARDKQSDEPAQGPMFTYGRAGLRSGKTGYLLRYDWEAALVYPEGHDDGAIIAYSMGYEWQRLGPDNWSFAVPIAWMFGRRVEPVRATLGFGVDLVAIDQVADDTGVGFFTPFVNARLGVDIKGFQLGVDGRYGYHWQIGADDRARWQLGAFVGKTFPSKRAIY